MFVQQKMHVNNNWGCTINWDADRRSRFWIGIICISNFLSREET